MLIVKGIYLLFRIYRPLTPPYVRFRIRRFLFWAHNSHGKLYSMAFVKATNRHVRETSSDKDIVSFRFHLAMDTLISL